MCRGPPCGILARTRTAGRCPQFPAVLERIKVRLPVGRPRTRPHAVAADKAYSSRPNRAYLRRRLKAVIPEKSDQAAHRKKRGSRGGRPISHDPDLHEQRNTVERCINQIKEWRGPAFRFGKTPSNYLAGPHLRGAVLWVRSLQSEDPNSVQALKPIVAGGCRAAWRAVRSAVGARPESGRRAVRPGRCRRAAGSPRGTACPRR